MPVTVVRTEIYAVRLSIEGHDPGPTGEKARSARYALEGPEPRKMLTEGRGLALAGRKPGDARTSAEELSGSAPEPLQVPENSTFLWKCYVRLLSAILGLAGGAGEMVDFYA